MHGTYLPHWTFDAQHRDRLQRACAASTTGRPRPTPRTARPRTREVMRTALVPGAAGTSSAHFDDVLVPGSTRLSPERLDDARTVAARERPCRTSPTTSPGYQTLRYDVEPDQGLQGAKQRMEQVIEGDCRGDIGGDEQRVVVDGRPLRRA